MNQRDFSIWLLPLLAALAIYLPGAGGQPTEAPPGGAALNSARSSSGSPATDRGQSAQRLVDLFLGVNGSDKRRDDYELAFLIATVPDPTDSGLGYLFDGHLAAIQRAAEASSYVLDRFDFPWSGKAAVADTEREKPVASPDKEPAKAAANKASPSHHREPGIVLFRRPYESQLLVLFLVGETPTAGIHKQALANAVHQVEALCGAKARNRCDEIRLLAPTFSGSVDSLKNALRELRRERPWAFTIVSGSATAIDRSRFLTGLEKTARFSATVTHQQQASDALVAWITRRHKDAKIALLIEAGTGYGEAAREKARQTGAQITVLPYPVHISQVRKTTERIRGSERTETQGAPRTRPRNLKLSLEEGDDARDILPPFSKFETFSVELMLSNLLSTISSEGIRYVGLFSTDVRDQIFLAGEIRKHSPDVILFTVGADLFYLHSDVNTAFHGMLLATTYPLFSKNQLWTFPFASDGRRMQFGNETALGVYNAALALLGQTDKMLEYAYPFDTQPKPEALRKPPLWLAVVGKDEIWPIAHFENRDPTHYLYEKPSAAQTKRPLNLEGVKLYSHRLLYVLVVFSLICLLFSGILIAGSLPPSAFRSGLPHQIAEKFPTAFKLFGDAVYRRFRVERQVYLFAFSASLLTLSLILARLFARYPVVTPSACTLRSCPCSCSVCLPWRLPSCSAPGCSMSRRAPCAGPISMMRIEPR